MQMFAFFDVKAQEWLEPFTAKNEIHARRTVINLLSRDPETNKFVRHREDFVLQRLGDFNEETGSFTPEPPVTLATFSALFDDLRALNAREGGV